MYRRLAESITRKSLAEFLRRKSANAEADSDSDSVSMEIPNDLFYQIFMSLPAEILFKLQFQCKLWLSLINNSNFVQTHARQSQTFILSDELIQLSKAETRFFFHFINVEDQSNNFVESSLDNCVELRASCDGLILAISHPNVIEENQSAHPWKIVNPITRKQIEFPAGFLGMQHESFGMAYCKEAKTYKVVHLFSATSNFMFPLWPICCEILDIRSRVWRTIEVPNIRPPNLVSFRVEPVCIGGSLHWLTWPVFTCECLCISFYVCNEKFVVTKLPDTKRRSLHTIKHKRINKLVEIGENLGYVADEEVSVLHVWIFKEWKCWMKVHSISLHVPCEPICCRGKGREILLKATTTRIPKVYAYNFETNEMKLVRRKSDAQIGFRVLLHRNTLVSFDHM